MTWHKAAIIAAVLSGVLFALPAKSQDIEAVQLYSDAELVEMFATNEHITQVRDVDRCQLAQDIEAQAELERRPTYQFLYGDMKAWGICYDRDPKIGLLYMEKAAEQGLVEALEQLGRYYHEGNSYSRILNALFYTCVRRRLSETFVPSSVLPVFY